MGTTREDVIPTLEAMPLFRGLPRGELEAISQQFDDATYLADHGRGHRGNGRAGILHHPRGSRSGDH